MESAEIPRSGATGGGTKHYILGTAGHIDHGKTRLVKALTGTDTDRLPEERRRGMTIELGFAELTIGDVRFGVVDVPGHERFVRTMVAGATGMDLALIVVAADDSVMPQTAEHIEILHLLGVSQAVVAITKIDTVEPDMVDLVTEEVQSLLAGSPLEDATVCPVSSTTGAGIDALSSAILDVAQGIEEQSVQPPFRMAVDRVFTVKGRGTVVTGSVLRGAVNAGDALEVWPHGDTCRVRDLQTHGTTGESLARGQRAAINLSGVDRDQLQRGCELASPGYLQPSRMVDVRLQCLSSCERPLKSTSIVRLGIGTVEVRARVVLYEGGQLEPGASGLAQLRSGEAITATYGQRFIMRDETATRTIGGGIVLRPVARRRRRDLETELEVLRILGTGNAQDRVEQVLRVAGFVRPSDLRICARAGVELGDLPEIFEQLSSDKRWVPIAGTDLNVVPAAVDDLKRRFVSWLERYHLSHADEPGRHVDAVLGWIGRMTSPSLARPLLDRLIQDKAVKLLGSFACLPAFAPALTGADEKLMAAMLDEIRRCGFQPPTLEGLSVAAQADRKRWQRLATLAVALGELVQIGGKLYLHADVERQLCAKVSELIQRQGSVTVAEVREELRSSRKFVVPFLEYLDRVGFTKRIEDRRVLA
ncbi:MAG: selenocysteine-specific translation elongation factor [Planctomycetota bacterium]|jgi:selenocysteine-specific elongation factor